LTLKLSDLRFSDFFSSNRQWKLIGVCLVIDAKKRSNKNKKRDKNLKKKHFVTFVKVIKNVTSF